MTKGELWSNNVNINIKDSGEGSINIISIMQFKHCKNIHY